MAAAAPVEVGAQGTVGSLVLREVEYFQRMDGGVSGKKSSSKVAAASGGSPRSSSGKKQQQKKKKTKVGVGHGSFLPRMCSSAEVADSHGGGGRGRPARVRYRPLGEEADALHQEDI